MTSMIKSVWCSNDPISEVKHVFENIVDGLYHFLKILGEPANIFWPTVVQLLVQGAAGPVTMEGHFRRRKHLSSTLWMVNSLEDFMPHLLFQSWTPSFSE